MNYIEICCAYMNRKKILIITIVTLLSLIFVATIGTFILGTKLLRSVTEDSDRIRSSILLHICNSGGDAQLNSELFALEFRERNKHEDITADFKLFMPTLDKCNEVFGYNGLIEMFRKKQSISINVEGGIKRATYSFLYGEKSSVTIKLIEKDKNWLIEGYLINKGA